MFVINLFGFVMITSTILIGVLFYNTATAFEQAIELELKDASYPESDDDSSPDYETLASEETEPEADETIPHSTDDDDWKEEETAE